ncbi:uncharacterized protein [Elaeis guineensis]|uniref:uncharacterized protein isoform X2 n=1 Tax=Elaeis guineensis var. tenera TaxID=51953 RepID=UPI003C6CD540
MEMVPELPRRASGEDPDDQLRVPLGSGRHRSSDRHPFDPKKTASTHPPLFQLLRPELGFSISGKPMLQNLSSHMVLVDIKIRHFPKQSVSTKDCRSWLYDGSKMAKPITPWKIKSSKSIGKGWLSQVRLDLHMMDQLATTGTSLSISQIYTNLLRVFFTGFLPLYRYEYLDYYIRVRLQLQPKSFKFVTAKVAADGLLCGPLDLLIFFSYMGFASGKSMDQVKEDVKKDFLPALLVEAGVWPFVQVANFRFVPVRYQLLYVNFFCLLDSTFLSWIEQQADAPWKKWFAPIVTLEDQKGQA